MNTPETDTERLERLAKVHGRPVSSIAAKCRTLGLLAPSAPATIYEPSTPWSTAEDDYLREIMCNWGTEDDTIAMVVEQIGEPFEDVQARMVYLSSLPYLGGPPPKSEVR